LCDFELCLVIFFDEGSVELFIECDDSGMFVVCGMVDGLLVVVFVSDVMI